MNIQFAQNLNNVISTKLSFFEAYYILVSTLTTRGTAITVGSFCHFQTFQGLPEVCIDIDLED